MPTLPRIPTHLAVIVTLLLTAASARAATPASDATPHLRPRVLRAARLAEPPPAIDGKLDESAWATAPVATDFVEGRPRPGALASLVSRARVLVDEEALYVGLEYDDPTPATILAPLARRDDETTSDWAFVEIDSRHDRHTGFSFGVNPRGVQVDGLWLSDTVYDSAWNSVWSAAAQVGPNGWTAEFRIPFSQIAFPLPAGATELVWGINFYRSSPGHKASSNWSPRYSGLAGVVSNFNELIVPAPARVRRLEATPYAALRTPDEGSAEHAFSGGGDVAAGLGPNFRLTATLLPDFGQVEADPSQVNLSAFELFQTERRPFFLEGLELFHLDTQLGFSVRDASFGNDAPFYSRRVGEAPEGSIPGRFEVVARPTTTTLLGAAKLIGDTSNGWTLGTFASASDAEHATLRADDGARVSWPIAPRSALGVVRAVHASRNGKTSFGLFGEHLQRSGLSANLERELVRESSSLGFDLRRRFADDAYETRAWLLGTDVAGSTEAVRAAQTSPRHLFQRPGSGHRLGGRRLQGAAGEATVARVGGNLRWSLAARGVSPGFDVDETGYQQTSDWLLLFGTWRYERFPSAGRLRLWAIGSDGLGTGWTTGGEHRATSLDLYLSGESRATAIAKLAYAREQSALSIGWLRGGPALLLPPRDAVSLSLATAQSKPTYATLDVAVEREPGSDSWSASASPLLNVRSSDRLQWSVGPSVRADVLGWQPVARPLVAGTPADLVARVEQRTLSLSLRADYTLSPKFSVQVYAQPFSTVGRYDRYQLLRAPRAARPGDRFTPLCAACVVPDTATGTLVLDLDGDGVADARIARPDGEQRSLNASAVLRWEFRPGSFLTVVWNQQRAETTNDVRRSAAGALDALRGDASTNQVLAKLSWRFGA